MGNLCEMRTRSGHLPHHGQAGRPVNSDVTETTGHGHAVGLTCTELQGWRRKQQPPEASVTLGSSFSVTPFLPWALLLLLPAPGCSLLVLSM